MNYLISYLKVEGTKTQILSHIKGDSANNLTNSFFKYTNDICYYCDLQKNKIIKLDKTTL